MKVEITVYKLELYEIHPSDPSERTKEIQRALRHLGLKIYTFESHLTEADLP